jgi:hypothetical protein
MNKLNGKSGRVKLGSAVSIASVAYANGVVTVTTSTPHGFVAGQFILNKSVAGMTDLNNGGKGMLVASAPTTTTFTVKLTTSQTYTTGGTVQRIIPITEWNLDADSEISETTDSESGDWKEKGISGHKDWKGDWKGFDYDGAAMAPLGESYAVELDIDANNYYSGTAIFKSFKTGAKVTGANSTELSGNFEGTGSLVKTSNATPA